MQHASKSEINEHFWKECGHLIDLPDVNSSQENFAIVNGRIRAPLSLVKGIGDAAHQQLCEGRPYKDIQDFCNKAQARKKNGGRNALTNGVVPDLIITGVMDSLFPPDSTVIDKFNMYSNALAVSKGSKRPERIEKCERFAKTNVYERYQIAKSLMPEFSISLMKTMHDREEPGITMDDKGYMYSHDLSDYRLVDMEELEKAIDSMPWIEGGYRVAVAGYVYEDRRFEYKDKNTGKKKEACSLTLDIEGATKSFVKWPDKSGKLPPSQFSEKLTGAIVVLVVEKYKEDKPFAINDVILIQPPFKKGEAE